MSASIVELKIVKGKTLELALYVGEEERVMKPIVAMVSTTPVTLTVVGHGLVDDWEIQVSGVKSPQQLNTAETGCSGQTRTAVGDQHRTYRVRVIDPDTIALFNINGSSWPVFVPGGIVEFNKPADLSGTEARAQLRRREGSSEVVLAFYSAGLPEYDPTDGTIEVDVVGSKYMLKLPAVVSEQLPTGEGVWDAEFITTAGDVYALVAVSPYQITGEVTR